MIINDVQFECELLDVLEELRSQLASNNISLLSKITPTTDNIMVSCPYHKGGQERRPSAGIHTTTGTFHCLACGETHTLFEVISHCFGHYDDLVGSFGWSWLLKNFATISIEHRKEIELNLNRDSSNRHRELTYVSEEELDSYRYYHPYMYKRKLTNEIIELFDIGFDFATSCITFPNRDISGKTLFVARRSVNTKFFNYPQGVDKPVYGLYEFNLIKNNVDKHYITCYSTNEVIICESMLDALACWSYGKCAVALNGLGTEEQFDTLRKMNCRKFILATDMDNAGKSARIKLRNKLRNNKLITEYVWDINVAKDINDMSKEMFDSLEEVF